MISGNENKIDLASGAAVVVPDAPPDSITLLDFSRFPPAVRHLENIPNSVIGPPSNIAILPDGGLALIADSLKLDSTAAAGWVPESVVHVLDLKSDPPRLTGRVTTGRQPSGMSITPDGKRALVANRADGTVSVLAIDGRSVRARETVEVCEPAESVSDVAIHPNGRLALASVQKGGYLAVLIIGPETVQATGRKVSVYGQPYRCVITPDGELALTAGQGFGNGLDRDALSVIDLRSDPIRTIDYVAVGAVPESIEISPDGRWVAAVTMEGSNLAADDPLRGEQGAVVLLERRGRTFERVQELPVGRIPEGVAFTPDGKHLVVQCHPDRELWLFEMRDGRLRDTGERIAVPGMPSSLRAGP
jgi:DNA-binding beta-propeller fold protein YncE